MAAAVPPKSLPVSHADTAESGSGVLPAALRQPAAVSAPQSAPALPIPVAPAADATVTNGTVVLDVEQGGIVVPSFAGKTVRTAIELAESSGLDLEVVGSGVGQNQAPPAGSHVASGARVTVRFGR